MPHRDDTRRGFIGLVQDLAAASGAKGLTIHEVRDRLDERGFGLMILILAIPCLVPALYGVPQIVGVPILLQDERLTTVQAERSLASAGVMGPARREVADQSAATFILQSYLDSQR